MRKHLARVYEGREILCDKCKIKKFSSIIGYPKEKYGVISIHKDNCSFTRRLLKNKLRL